MKKTMNMANLVAVARIQIDPRFQMRVELDEKTIERYREFYLNDPDRLPPIMVVQDGRKFIVIEGFHRLEAAKRAGLKKIPVILLVGDENGIMWHALGANNRGLPMTPNDLKKAVNAALDFFPATWQHEIAKQVGCSIEYVREIERERGDRTCTDLEEEFESLLGKLREIFLQLSDGYPCIYRVAAKRSGVGINKTVKTAAEKAVDQLLLPPLPDKNDIYEGDGFATNEHGFFYFDPNGKKVTVDDMFRKIEAQDWDA